MNWFDILVLALMGYAAFRGYITGFVRQVISIAGVVVGALLAWACGSSVGSIFVDDANLAFLVGFIIVFLAVVIGLTIAGFLIKRVIRVAGLGKFDTGLGIFVSLLKMWVVVSILGYWLDVLPLTHKVTAESIAPNSAFYEPMVKSAELIFPFVDSAKESLVEMQAEQQQEQ